MAVAPGFDFFCFPLSSLVSFTHLFVFIFMDRTYHGFLPLGEHTWADRPPVPDNLFKKPLQGKTKIGIFTEKPKTVLVKDNSVIQQNDPSFNKTAVFTVLTTQLFWDIVTRNISGNKKGKEKIPLS